MKNKRKFDLHDALAGKLGAWICIGIAIGTIILGLISIVLSILEIRL